MHQDSDDRTKFVLNLREQDIGDAQNEGQHLSDGHHDWVVAEFEHVEVDQMWSTTLTVLFC